MNGCTLGMDYEITVFGEHGHPSITIRTSCDTDTEALVKIVRMGIIDYQVIEVWRDLERIYVGRRVPRRGRRNYRVASLISQSNLIFGYDSY